MHKLQTFIEKLSPHDDKESIKLYKPSYLLKKQRSPVNFNDPIKYEKLNDQSNLLDKVATILGTSMR